MSSKGSSVISTPKGGGAQSGLGEKFSPDLFTGTGNFSVPVALPAGRNGFQPEMTIGYSSGSGNSPFGLGWSLSIPGVMRKTAKGVPQYREDFDVFILSGAEDLVFIADEMIDLEGASVKAQRYRPRTEGLFARIYRIKDGNNDCWKVMSKDGLVSYYGTPNSAGNDNACIHDPKNVNKVFAWKLTKTVDLFGNNIIYSYFKEQVKENEFHVWDQNYISEIKYINYEDSVDTERYLARVSFLYGNRPDPFSEYKSGFEIRTNLRCEKIEIFTHPYPADEIKSKTYHFYYSDEIPELNSHPINNMSLLCRVEVEGHDGELSEKMPPLDFTYSRYEPGKQKFNKIKGNDLPKESISNPNYTLVSLFGNGLPDILEVNGYVRYWRNMGGGTFDMPRLMREAPAGFTLQDPEVQLIDADGDGQIDFMVNKPGISGFYPSKFGAGWDKKSFKKYKQAPSFNLFDPEVKLVDLTGDGVTDAIRSGAGFECYFNDPEQGWTGTRVVQRKQLDAFPNVNFSDARIRWADMSGDGMQDMVYVHSGNVSYWANLGYGSFGKKVQMKKAPRFPQNFDPKRILLGDVDGDGCADLVYIDFDKITIWFNQSGNAFSEPTVIAGTPLIADPSNIRLEDILGTGTAGLLYSINQISTGKHNLYFLDLTGGVKPYLLNTMRNNMGSLTKVAYTSSIDYYLRDEYPHLYATAYASFNNTVSKKWRTPLPFPVQVVACVEVVDEISKGKLSTVYHYRHGYWDGGEREFRGFGRVDQYDTEGFVRYNNESATGLNQSQDLPNTSGFKAFEANTFNAVDFEYYSPPTCTRNWFHLGPIGPEYGEWFELNLSDEFWQEDPSVLHRPQETVNILNALPRRAKRDAIRTFRGNMLRSELYAVDSLNESGLRPYTVSENSQGLIDLSPEASTTSPLPIAIGTLPTRGGNGFEWSRSDRTRFVFFPFAVASRTTQWERGNDPMTQFSFTTDYDAYGQARKQLSVALPRAVMPPYTSPNTVSSGEGRFLSTLSFTAYAQRDNEIYMVDRVCRSLSYEVIPQVGESVFQLSERVLNDNLPIASNTADYNILSCSINFYDGTAFTGLSYGQLGDYGVLTKSELLLITDAIIDEAYHIMPECFKPTPNWSFYPPLFQSEMQNADPRLGYTKKDALPYTTGWYTITAKTEYDFQDGVTTQPKGLVMESRDVFDNRSTIVYDDYAFLPLQSRQYYDSVNYLETNAEYDYRVLQAWKITDPNQNRTVFAFSPLGLMKASGLIGKYDAYEGDIIWEENGMPGGGNPWDPPTVNPLMWEPSTKMEYDFFAFANNGLPVWVKTIQREWHWQQDPDEDSPTIIKIEYSDGFGRLLQTRTQAEDVIFGTLENNEVVPRFGDSGLPIDQDDPNQDAIGHERGESDPLNVVVSGWKVYNNKGWVVEQYEPYFDRGFGYKAPFNVTPSGSPADGVYIRMYYDPRGQVVHTVNPDGTEQRVIFGVPNGVPTAQGKVSFTPTPWESYTYDANDLTSGNYAFDTPKSALVDALGRTIKTTEHRATALVEDVVMQYEYDIRGNLLKVTDALDRTAFEYTYDLKPKMGEEDSGANVLKTIHIDNGTSRMLPDSLGKTIMANDARETVLMNTYDRLQRPLSSYTYNAISAPLQLIMVNVYGEGAVDALEHNLMGKLYEQYDGAGKIRLSDYDFKGNLLNKVRNVVKDDTLKSSLNGYNPFYVDWSSFPSILDSTDYETDSQYDALNRITKITLPQNVESDRKEIVPSYNKAGALEKVSYDEKEYVKHIAYNAKGQRLLIAFGNDLMSRYVYDAENFRLVRQRSEKYSVSSVGSTITYAYASGTNRQDDAYAYDLVGNILGIISSKTGCGVGGTDSLSRAFTYDPLYRLASASGRENVPGGGYPFPGWSDTSRNTDPNTTTAYTRYYSYDKMGNLEELQQTGSNAFTRVFDYTESSGVKVDNKLDEVTIGSAAYSYTYDILGNILTENSNRHYLWDGFSRLMFFKNQVGSAEPSVEAQYLYDSGGNRVKKIVRKQGGDFEITVYIDGLFEYHTDETDEQNTVHIMDDKSRIATVRIGDAMGDSTPWEKYVLENNIGSSMFLLDENAAMVNEQEYYPFGETSFGSYGKKKYQYCGKERDSESGLYYYGARYYLPWLCRFASVDPLAGDYPFYTPYQYAGNMPINFIDIDGLEPAQPPSSNAMKRYIPVFDDSGKVYHQIQYQNVSPSLEQQYINDNNKNGGLGVEITRERANYSNYSRWRPVNGQRPQVTTVTTTITPTTTTYSGRDDNSTMSPSSPSTRSITFNSDPITGTVEFFFNDGGSVGNQFTIIDDATGNTLLQVGSLAGSDGIGRQGPFTVSGLTPGMTINIIQTPQNNAASSDNPDTWSYELVVPTQVTSVQTNVSRGGTNTVVSSPGFPATLPPPVTNQVNTIAPPNTVTTPTTIGQ